jgi:hypothetical protein
MQYPVSALLHLKITCDISMLSSRAPKRLLMRVGCSSWKCICQTSTPWCHQYVNLSFAVVYLPWPYLHGMPLQKIRFLTKIYHPNIDKLGRICLDILKDKQVKLYLTSERALCRRSKFIHADGHPLCKCVTYCYRFRHLCPLPILVRMPPIPSVSVICCCARPIARVQMIRWQMISQRSGKQTKREQ